MFNYRYLVLLLSIFGFFSTACTDLDETVYGDFPAKLYPENKQQANQLMVPAYNVLRKHADDGWWFAQEITGDLIVAPTRGSDWDDGGKWRDLHQHTWNGDTEALKTMWNNFYKGISECNFAIEKLETGDKEVVANSIAQLRVLRAYYYYCLIDNFGDVPYVTSFSNAVGAPEKEARATVFNSIVEEVKESIPALKGGSLLKVRVNEYTAYALLAKLYLNAEVFTGTSQLDDAATYTQMVIDGPYSLESKRLAPFYAENEDSNENIFTIFYDEEYGHGFLLHRRSLHYGLTTKYDANTSFWNGFCAQERLVDLFEDEDTRKNGLLLGKQYASDGTEIIDPDVTTVVNFTKNIPALKIDASASKAELKYSGARMVKFEVKKGVKDHMDNDFPIFRLADFLLMKAEIILRKGDAPTALPIVNDIRTRAGASLFTELTMDNLLEERGRELWCEGHRRQDLIRFGKFGESWWEKESSATNRQIFMIPQEQIDKNPNLGK